MPPSIAGHISGGSFNTFEVAAYVNVPLNDKFQVITEHAPEELNITPSYMGVNYSADIVLIQITLSRGRSVELKQAFYKRIADDLHRELGLDRQDVFISLVEAGREDWSFGNGVAQYVEADKKAAK